MSEVRCHLNGVLKDKNDLKSLQVVRKPFQAEGREPERSCDGVGRPDPLENKEGQEAGGRVDVV